jgi:hypothetical protein
VRYKSPHEEDHDPVRETLAHLKEVNLVLEVRFIPSAAWVSSLSAAK